MHHPNKTQPKVRRECWPLGGDVLTKCQDKQLWNCPQVPDLRQPHAIPDRYQAANHCRSSSATSDGVPAASRWRSAGWQTGYLPKPVEQQTPYIEGVARNFGCFIRRLPMESCRVAKLYSRALEDGRARQRRSFCIGRCGPRNLRRLAQSWSTFPVGNSKILGVGRQFHAKACFKCSRSDYSGPVVLDYGTGIVAQMGIECDGRIVPESRYTR